MRNPRQSWTIIEKGLDGLIETDGGFSLVRRGTMRLPDGEEIFVKIGNDDATKKWANKEIATYRFLQRNNYPYIPDLISSNDDETGFALEALTAERGWDWTATWDEQRLVSTLEAMDALAELKPQDHELPLFTDNGLSVVDDGWTFLTDSPDVQQTLLAKLDESELSDSLTNLDFSVSAERSSQYRFTQDALIHKDLRADNCAWHAGNGEVKVIDWNWAQLDDRRIDLAAFLVSVHNSGFEVLSQYESRLDSDALHWLAGFWFKEASQPIWPGGPEHLRDFQLRSGAVAYQLARGL